MLKEKFGFTDDNFGKKYLYGDRAVTSIPAPEMPQAVREQFEKISGRENVTDDGFSRVSHAFGKFYGELLQLRKGEVSQLPDLVVYPRNEGEIVKILALCRREKIAVTPMGGRSSVTRAVETPYRGVGLDLTRHMNQILEVNKTNATVEVQPGIYGPVLEGRLQAEGFTCGHFPQSFEYSTVGGWVAARGAGQASTGYGKIEGLVLALRVVTPAGTVETRPFPATAVAWDYNKVFIGAEGTLGVITSVTMKIRKYLPENTRYASFLFRDFASATHCMREVMQSRAGFPFLFRLSDAVETDTAFRIRGFDHSLSDRFLKMRGFRPEKRCLMLATFEGDREYACLVQKKVKKTARKYGAFYTGKGPVKAWLQQRYESAYLRDPLMDAGVMTDTVETSVTWDNLLHLWSGVRQYLESREKTHVMAHISHVYENGANLYFTFLGPMREGEELADYIRYHQGLIDAILAHGGSLTHHHGIGRALAPWMGKALGKTAMEILQAVKKALDPDDIMNPGNTLGLK